MRIYLKKTILTALGGIIALCTAQANAALVVVETDDFAESINVTDGYLPGDPVNAPDVGALQNGVNRISGNLSASCINSGGLGILCSPIQGFDSDVPGDWGDSFTVFLAAGATLQNAILETSSDSTAARGGVKGAIQVLNILPTSGGRIGGFTLAPPVPASVNLMGGTYTAGPDGAILIITIEAANHAPTVGTYSQDWAFLLDVTGIEPASEVPLPAAAWFMGAGIAAFSASKRRKAAAVKAGNIKSAA